MPLAFDVETHPIKHVGKIAVQTAPKLVCLSGFDGKRTFLVKRAEALSLFRSWLEGTEVLIAHNASFDVWVLATEDPSLVPLIVRAYEDDRIVCTEILERQIRIARGELAWKEGEDGEREPVRYSLADIVRMRFGRHLEKDDTWRLHYALLEDVPLERWPESAKAYALQDSVEAFEVYQDQRREPYPTPNLGVDCRAALSLHTAWGPRTDPEAVNALERALTKSVEEANAKLLPTGLIKPKKKGGYSKDTKKIQALLEASGATAMTPTGKLKSGKEQLLASGNADLMVLGESMGDRKLLETYVPVLRVGSEYPLCARYVLPIESGRTSCRAPNLQNPPRKGGVRECFIARPGFVYVGADLDQAELRSWSQACLWRLGFSDMARAFREGKDPHLMLAAQFAGVSYEEAARRLELGDPVISDLRQFSKTVNFGLPGGMGDTVFAENARKQGVKFQGKTIDRYLAKRIRQGWFATWSEARPYLNGISAEHDARMPIVHPGTGFVRAVDRYAERANSYFQHLTAQVAKLALWEVFRETMGGALKGSHLSMFLHDEIILEVPERNVHEAGEVLAALMLNAAARVLPDVPSKSTPVAMRRWYKGAKRVAENGRLVPGKPVGGKWVADG